MVNYFFSYCQLCGQSVDGPLDLCRGCAGDLPWLEHACQGCGLPLVNPFDDFCGHCLQHPPPWQQLVVVWRYEWPLDQLIGRFKYQRQLPPGRLLGDLLLAHLRRHYQHRDWPELLVPTPLHRWRRWRRGFNQSELLARQLQSALGLPCADLLQRRRATPAQQGLSRHQRQRNLQGAFQLRTSPTTRRIALIDDVITTGSTLAEMARLLRTSGVEEVHCWCLARTL